MIRDFNFIFQHASSYAENVISMFIEEYTKTQRAEEGNFSSGSTHTLLPTAAKPIHGPVIHLFIELLKLSLVNEGFLNIKLLYFSTI